MYLLAPIRRQNPAEIQDDLRHLTGLPSITAGGGWTCTMTEGAICAATFSPSEHFGSLLSTLFPISKSKLYAHLSMTLICTGLRIPPVFPHGLFVCKSIHYFPQNSSKATTTRTRLRLYFFRARKTKDTGVHDSILQHTKISPAASDADKVSITVSLSICAVPKMLPELNYDLCVCLLHSSDPSQQGTDVKIDQ